MKTAWTEISFDLTLTTSSISFCSLLMLQTSNTKQQRLNRKPKKEKQIRASSQRVDESQQEDFYVSSSPTHFPASVVLPSETLTNTKVYSVAQTTEAAAAASFPRTHTRQHVHSYTFIFLLCSTAHNHTAPQTNHASRASSAAGHCCSKCSLTPHLFLWRDKILVTTSRLEDKRFALQSFKMTFIHLFMVENAVTPFWTKHFQILFIRPRFSPVLLQNSLRPGTLVGFLHHQVLSQDYRLWVKHSIAFLLL